MHIRSYFVQLFALFLCCNVAMASVEPLDDGVELRGCGNPTIMNGIYSRKLDVSNNPMFHNGYPVYEHQDKNTSGENVTYSVYYRNATDGWVVDTAGINPAVPNIKAKNGPITSAYPASQSTWTNTCKVHPRVIHLSGTNTEAKGDYVIGGTYNSRPIYNKTGTTWKFYFHKNKSKWVLDKNAIDTTNTGIASVATANGSDPANSTWLQPWAVFRGAGGAIDYSEGSFQISKDDIYHIAQLYNIPISDTDATNIAQRLPVFTKYNVNHDLATYYKNRYDYYQRYLLTGRRQLGFLDNTNLCVVVGTVAYGAIGVVAFTVGGPALSYIAAGLVVGVGNHICVAAQTSGLNAEKINSIPVHEAAPISFPASTVVRKSSLPSDAVYSFDPTTEFFGKDKLGDIAHFGSKTYPYAAALSTKSIDKASFYYPVENIIHSPKDIVGHFTPFVPTNSNALAFSYIYVIVELENGESGTKTYQLRLKPKNHLCDFQESIIRDRQVVSQSLLGLDAKKVFAIGHLNIADGKIISVHADGGWFKEVLGTPTIKNNMLNNTQDMLATLGYDIAGISFGDSGHSLCFSKNAAKDVITATATVLQTSSEMNLNLSSNQIAELQQVAQRYELPSYVRLYPAEPVDEIYKRLAYFEVDKQFSLMDPSLQVEVHEAATDLKQKLEEYIAEIKIDDEAINRNAYFVELGSFISSSFSGLADDIKQENLGLCETYDPICNELRESDDFGNAAMWASYGYDIFTINSKLCALGPTPAPTGNLRKEFVCSALPPIDAVHSIEQELGLSQWKDYSGKIRPGKILFYGSLDTWFSSDTSAMAVMSFDAAESSAQDLVISFRGSSCMDDYITDVNYGMTQYYPQYANGGIGCFPSENPTDERFVHKGFFSSWNNWTDKLHEVVTSSDFSTKPIRYVYIVGHSLGGALATISAPDIAAFLRENFKLEGKEQIKVITFGAPRVGNESMTLWFEPKKQDYSLYRVYNDGDLIERLPFNIQGYEQFSDGVRLNPPPQIFDERMSAAQYIWKISGDFYKKTTGETVVPNLTSHSMEAYRYNIAKKFIPSSLWVSGEPRDPGQGECAYYHFDPSNPSATGFYSTPCENNVRQMRFACEYNRNFIPQTSVVTQPVIIHSQWQLSSNSSISWSSNANACSARGVFSTPTTVDDINKLQAVLRGLGGVQSVWVKHRRSSVSD